MLNSYSIYIFFSQSKDKLDQLRLSDKEYVIIASIHFLKKGTKNPSNNNNNNKTEENERS